MKISLVLVGFLSLASAAKAGEIPLDQISSYLNSLGTAEAGFSQINADGSKSAGKLYIQRPGRARFEYAPPEETLVLASGGQVAIFDAKSNEEPTQYPLKRTPLNLILAKKIDLGTAKMVVDHHAEGNATHVVAQDPEHPEYGSIDLVFTANPIALRQWVITDDMGQGTTVILSDFKTGADYKPSMFSIQTEMGKRGFNP